MRRGLAGGLAAIAALAAMLLAASGSSAEVADATLNYQTWFFRAEPVAPVVPLPEGPIQPVTNEQINPPQQISGGYVVASGGGEPGGNEGQTDLAWAGFQWDLASAQGGAVDEFILTLAQAPEERGDNGTAVMQACNIAAVWAASPTSQPWAARPPVDCSTAIPPTEGTANGQPTWTFDLTALAKGWLDGTGSGVMIVPGNPTVAPPIAPFQLTFAGYDYPEPAVQPKVTFRYTPAGGEAVSEPSGLSDFALGADQTTGDLVAVPDIDVIPTDVGSSTGAAAPVAQSGTPPTIRTRPASSGGTFPVLGWLLVPLAVLAFWGTGTALGPAGEPILAREGGVSRVLATRRATQPTRS